MKQAWLRSRFALVTAILLAIGCNDSASGPTTVSLSGVVTEFVPDPAVTGPPIPGVEVCQFGSLNCDVTNEQGEYSLRVLKGLQIELSHIAEGYGPVLIARRTGVVDFTGNAVLATDEVLQAFAEELGETYPPATSGFLTAIVYRGATQDGELLAGATYSLIGSSAVGFYLADDGVPDTALTETGALGSGGFFRVAPLTVDLRIAGAANCTSEPSWNVEATNTFRFPARVGFWTQTEINCE